MYSNNIKKALPHGLMIVGGHPWIRLAMVCVRQGGGGGSANHKENRKIANGNHSQKYKNFA